MDFMLISTKDGAKNKRLIDEMFYHQMDRLCNYDNSEKL